MHFLPVMCPRTPLLPVNRRRMHAQALPHLSELPRALVLGVDGTQKGVSYDYRPVSGC